MGIHASQRWGGNGDTYLHIMNPVVTAATEEGKWNLEPKCLGSTGLKQTLAHDG